MTLLEELRQVARIRIASGKQMPTFRAHFKWEAEEDEFLLSSRSIGFAFKAIARELPGRSPKAVASRWYALNGRPA